MPHEWKLIDTAPKTPPCEEIEVMDAKGRKALAYWAADPTHKDGGMWVSGGIHHGHPRIRSLDAHPWTHWREINTLKIVADSTEEIVEPVTVIIKLYVHDKSD